MSHKRQRYTNKKQQRQRYAVTSSPTAQEQDIDLSGEQIMLLTTFLHDVQEVRSQNPQSAMPDMSKIALSIAQNPQLASVLDAIRQREDAKALAMDGYATKSAPMGSYSQAANAASARWGASKDDNDPIGVPNYSLLRRWADENVWVRAAIDIRRNQIEGMRPVCIPIDPKQRFDLKIQTKVNNLLKRPNERRESWRGIIGPALEDVLTLDRGALLKSMTLDRKPAALYFADGATIRIYPGWDGNPAHPRYLYVSPDGKTKTPLRNDECILMVSKSASHRVSLSPVQALQATIIADIEATATAARLGKLKPPPHALQFPKATPKMIQDMATDYDMRIAGKKEMLFLGGPEAAHHFPLVYSAKDNQLLEWQVYLGRKIAVLFQISPQKLGITMDVNRANGEVQEEIDEDRGLIPLLLLVEEYMNVEILGDFATVLDSNGVPDLDVLNLKVIFPEVSDAARKLHAKETVEMAAKGLTANMPSLTLNMVMSMLGEEPVPGGDTFYVNTMSGPVKWLSYDEPLETMPQNTPVALPDEASNATEDSKGKGSNNAQDTNTEDTGKGKMYSGYDSRMPGKSWSPSVIETGLTTKSKNKQKIPPAYRDIQRSPEMPHHEMVLSNAVKKLFDDASARGERALQRLENGL